ncbi:MAG: hypothetical protein QXW12_03810 [Nitrososphaerota archaeon]
MKARYEPRNRFLKVLGDVDELKFIVVPFNLGGKCIVCGKLCPTCFKKFLKGNSNG